jgi:hypothetical protein
LLGTMEKMRGDLRALQVGPSHNNPRRCGACGHGEQCEARLDGKASAAPGSLP